MNGYNLTNISRKQSKNDNYSTQTGMPLALRGRRWRKIWRQLFSQWIQRAGFTKLNRKLEKLVYDFITGPMNNEQIVSHEFSFIFKWSLKTDPRPALASCGSRWSWRIRFFQVRPDEGLWCSSISVETRCAGLYHNEAMRSTLEILPLWLRPRLRGSRQLENCLRYIFSKIRLSQSWEGRYLADHDSWDFGQFFYTADVSRIFTKISVWVKRFVLLLIHQRQRHLNRV